MKEKSKKVHNKYNKHATSSIIRRHISICSSFSSSYIFDFKGCSINYILDDFEFFL